MITLFRRMTLSLFAIAMPLAVNAQTPAQGGPEASEQAGSHEVLFDRHDARVALRSAISGWHWGKVEFALQAPGVTTGRTLVVCDVRARGAGKKTRSHAKPGSIACRFSDGEGRNSARLTMQVTSKGATGAMRRGAFTAAGLDMEIVAMAGMDTAPDRFEAPTAYRFLIDGVTAGEVELGSRAIVRFAAQTNEPSRRAIDLAATALAVMLSPKDAQPAAHLAKVDAAQ